MFKEIEIYDNDAGDVEVVKFPAKYEVCHRCQGKGVHDCWEGGMTQDEMYEQSPDFFDDYMAGVYSKRCTVCNGERVVLEVDRSRCSAKDLVKYNKHLDKEYEMEAERRAEQYFGY